MITIRKSADRGAANFGWLNSKHSFSFGSYHDPEHMGFGSLRVINDDRVEPGQGFDTHPHKDMEIISYVVDGSLEHKDSMGNGSSIESGEVQRMTAGTGILHSEFNPSTDKAVHFLQIWILPERASLEPGYEQKKFAREDKLNQLCLVASREGREKSLKVHRDADIYASVAEPGSELTHTVAAGRQAWLQVVRGALSVNGYDVSAGDGAAITDNGADGGGLRIVAGDESEFLLFDMAQTDT